MMRHFVGNAFLYHEPPHEIETDVQVPILNDPNSSTDYVVMNVERTELSEAGRERQESLPETTGLGAEILREHGSLGVDHLMALRDGISVMLRESPEKLIWSGFPDKAQRIAIADLALLVAHRRHDPTGIHTPGMVGWAWSQLGRIRTLPKFLRWFAGTWFERDKAAGVDAAFQFLQACEFAFPRTLAATEAIIRQLQPGADVGYAAYIAGIETWFRPPWMKELDEAGVPLPLAERLASHIRRPSDRAEALRLISEFNLNESSEFDEVDQFIISLALS